MDTGCFFSFGLRNGSVVCLLHDFLGPKGLLCDPMTERKLILGKKINPMVTIRSQADGQKKTTNSISCDFSMIFRVSHGGSCSYYTF